MKFLNITATLCYLVIIGCNDQPTRLSLKVETIEVMYVNWACDCADFIETRYFKENPNYQVDEKDCIFIEPANSNLKIPTEYYEKTHFEKYLQLVGAFYIDKGIPRSYEMKTPVKPGKARVFRYKSFKFVDKPEDKNSNKENLESALKSLKGVWIHKKDSLATLNISNTQWTFDHKAEPLDTSNIYGISLTNRIPEYVDTTGNADFILLTNKKETMYSEILNLDAETLSLLHFPSGNLHTYRKRH
jgi:hypothetical protein